MSRWCAAGGREGMRLARPRQPRDEDQSVLPLINVVFLLLIFFMVAGTLAAIDPFAVAPPVSDSEGPVEPGEIVVLLASDGRLALNGATIPEDAFAEAISARRADGAAGTVRLKADGNADTADVVRVLDLLRQGGVERVRLLTLPAAAR